MMCKDPYIKTPVGVKKLSVVLSRESRLAATPFPCGQCMPCRINRSRVWQHRIELEMLSHPFSSFVTLTYAEEKLPEDNSVSIKELQNFMKRIRYYADPRKIKYYGVGEYGDLRGRPHYHIALFGIHATESYLVQRCWLAKGFIQITPMSKHFATYITGYIAKGLTKSDDFTRKRLGDRFPEFMRCSKSDGGLGVGTIRKMSRDLKDNKFIKKLYIKELQYGKKKRPLGGHLTKKFNEYLETDEAKRDLEFWEYQQEIFDKHLKNFNYKGSIVKEDEQKRLVQETKYKLFRSRRPL